MDNLNSKSSVFLSQLFRVLQHSLGFEPLILVEISL